MITQLGLTLLLMSSAEPVEGRTQQPNPQEVFERAVADFLGGRVAESVAGFDTLADGPRPGAATLAARDRPLLRRPLPGLPVAV